MSTYKIQYVQRMLFAEVSPNEEFREYSQSQGFLLPPSLDEFVPENHKARIINDEKSTCVF